MRIIITDDLFRRKRKFRQVINDDNDSDDDDNKQDSVRLKFELKSPDSSKSSLPMETMTFEIDDSSQSEERENNVPKNVPENVPENVPLNLGVPFNYVHHMENRNTSSPIEESESEVDETGSDILFN
jgi:hypothetical protein